MSDAFVPFPAPTVKARFVRRYKRFFVDAELDGAPITAHTANTGAMTGMLREGCDVLLTHEPKPTRKLDYSLQATRPGESWIGCNTALPNRLVEVAAEAGLLPEIAGHTNVRREVTVGGKETTRVDLVFEGARGGPDAYCEVKNATLREDNRVLFPDAVSARGLRQLTVLGRQLRYRPIVLAYVVQRTDVDTFAPARDIDPAYCRVLTRLAARGAHVVALGCAVERGGVRVRRRLDVDLD